MPFGTFTADLLVVSSDPPPIQGMWDEHNRTLWRIEAAARKIEQRYGYPRACAVCASAYMLAMNDNRKIALRGDRVACSVDTRAAVIMECVVTQIEQDEMDEIPS
jgi:hypothetical protein